MAVAKRVGLYLAMSCSAHTWVGGKREEGRGRCMHAMGVGGVGGQQDRLIPCYLEGDAMLVGGGA